MQDGERTIQILIADHHTMFRQGLRRLLENEPGFVVVGEAGNSQEVIDRSRQLKPDVLLFDTEMPNAGLETLRQIASQASSLRILLFVDQDQDPNQIVRALQLGAKGTVLKVSSAEVLVKAIRSVYAGEYWADRRITTWARSAGQNQNKEDRLGLTTRELQVISEILAGASNRDIAAKFSISEDTVKRHLSNIYNKLGVSNRLELTLYALANKLDIAGEPV